MAKGTGDRSIFKGTDEEIYSFLGLGDGETTDQISTCRRLTSAPKGIPSFDTLLSNLYGLIEGNRRQRMPSLTQPSQENWRTNDKRQTSLSKKNRSPEVLLERAIALLGEHGELEDWFNQVPVASGLIDHEADKRAAIDLLRFNGEHGEFVELKWESNTPVFAAFEILLYGLVYLYARVNRKTLGYLEKPLMSVCEVSLRVLAPRAYYTDYHLEWLEQGLFQVLLERAIALLGEHGELEDWFNQVPVASGLIDHEADKRAAIDLLRFNGEHGEFVELKWESNTPVFAAFEILLYGLVYLYARVNRKTLGYLEKPLMSVCEVSLRVLAPRAYYTDYHLEWLEQGLDEGIRTLAVKKTDGALSMGFGFLAFPQDFASDISPPYATGKEVHQKFDPPMDAEACRSLVSAMDNLEPAFRSGGREHS